MNTRVHACGKILFAPQVSWDFPGERMSRYIGPSFIPVTGILSYSDNGCRNMSVPTPPHTLECDEQPRARGSPPITREVWCPLSLRVVTSVSTENDQSRILCMGVCLLVPCTVALVPVPRVPLDDEEGEGTIECTVECQRQAQKRKHGACFGEAIGGGINHDFVFFEGAGGGEASECIDMCAPRVSCVYVVFPS